MAATDQLEPLRGEEHLNAALLLGASSLHRTRSSPRVGSLGAVASRLRMPFLVLWAQHASWLAYFVMASAVEAVERARMLVRAATAVVRGLPRPRRRGASDMVSVCGAKHRCVKRNWLGLGCSTLVNVGGSWPSG